MRRWRVEDAEALHELLLANLDHLRPWMAWIEAEPVDLAARRSKIRAWRDQWDAGEDFSYAIVDVGNGELLGACGLHRRIGAGGLELGYWIRGDRTGQGIATDAARALCEAAFSLDDITRVEIHHDAANTASARIPEKIGFQRVGERPDDVVAPAEVGIEVVWRLDRDAAAIRSAVRPGASADREHHGR